MPKIIKDEDIFREVIRIIAKNGYLGSSTKQMAEAAGIAEVTLFRKYKSKEELVKMAINSIREEIMLENALKYTGNIEKDLLQIVKVFLRLSDQFGDFLIEIIYESGRSKELFQSLEGPNRISQTVRKIISQYQKEGILINEPPSITIIALISPLLLYSRIKISGQDIADEFKPEKFVERFLRGRLVSF